MNCKVCGKTSNKNNSVSFFRFPKETTKCESWAERCNLLSLFKEHGTLRFYKSFRICSDHFDVKHVIFDGRKKRLLPSAVPFIEKGKTKEDRTESLCRLCAEENKNLTDIYGWRGKLLNLEGKIKYLPLKLNKQDPFPPKICSQCLTKLNQLHDFICNCLKADIKLKQIFCIKGDNTTQCSNKWTVKLKNNTQEHPFTEGKPDANVCKSISFDHNYSNTLLKNEFKMEIKSRNGKSLGCMKEAKEPCDIYLKSFQLFNAQNSPLVGETDLRKEFNFKSHSETFYSRFESDQCIPRHLSKACDKKNHEVALLENESFAHQVKMTSSCSMPGSPQSNPERCDQTRLKSFTNKSSLIFRPKKTSIISRQKCQFCDRSFGTRQACLNHVAKHTGETPYRCKECGKTFRSRPSLRQHGSVHSDQRLYSCHLCGRSFKRKDTLRNHLRIHTGERPFVCQVCGFAFKQRGDCIKHEKNHENTLELDCRPTDLSVKELVDAWNEEKPTSLPSYSNSSDVARLDDIVDDEIISFNFIT